MSHKKAVLFVLLCAVLISIGQLFLKLGAINLSLTTLTYIYKDYTLLAGIFIYFVSSIVFLYTLRKNDLSLLFPMLATSYVWVLLLSMYFFKEVIKLQQITGILAIVLGVSLIGFGGNR